MANYLFYKLENDHYTVIQELYKRSFGMYKTINEIKHKYNTDKWMFRNLGFLAKDENGDNAGYYGAFPITMNIDGKPHLVAQSGDTMTAPEHQKKGLFVELAKQTYMLAEKEGFSFVFGFPNENSLPGFKNKLNWIFTGYMQDFRISNKTLPLCELSSKNKLIELIYMRYCKLVLKKYILDFEEINNLNFYTNEPLGYILRDRNFFNYKKTDFTHLVKLNGFVIYFKLDVHLTIGDVVEFQEDKAIDFLKTIKFLSRLLMAKETVFSLTKNHWLFNILSKYFEPINGLPIGYLSFVDSINFEQITLTRADFDTF